MKPSPILMPFSWLYGAGIFLRNLFFDFGLLRSNHVPVPVISVGSLTAGGSGKTPLVELIVRQILLSGKKLTILSRGYKRKTKGLVQVSDREQILVDAKMGGDEPVLLAEKLPGVCVVSDSDRVRGARYGIEAIGTEIILLDDGFQHRYLARDLEIVVLSASEILNQSFLIPAGYRREQFSSLRRAHLVVISKCAGIEEFEKAETRLQKWYRGDIIGTSIQPVNWTEVRSHEIRDLDHYSGNRVVALSGIADPESFEKTLWDTGVEVVGRFHYSDHEWFTERELPLVKECVDRTSASFVITTEKDLKRIEADANLYNQFLYLMNLCTLNVKMVVLTGKDKLENAIQKIC